MKELERMAARDRIGFLSLRLHALMKKRWRQELEKCDREKLLDIAALKIHESRIQAQAIYELTGLKRGFGGNFNTGAYEIAKIRNAAVSDGEIFASGLQAEKRSASARKAAKAKGEKFQKLRVEPALDEFKRRQNLRPRGLTAAAAANNILAKPDMKDMASHGVLKRRISKVKKADK